MRPVLALAFIGVLAAGFSGATAADFIGPPTVLNGELLQVKGENFKLFGIDAPDLAQTCEARGATYACGIVARAALMDLVAGATVRCTPLDRTSSTRGGRPVVARCFAGGYDLSEGMVYTGWALAMPRGGTKYSAFEKEAETARRGLWRGTFTRPWEWRAKPN